jgi:GDP-4-dehydro-6-deoxy-D-mannose reductase
MRVLVTGASGFSGTHLLRLLKTEGAIIFTHGPEKGILGEHFNTSIDDIGSLIRVVEKVRPDYVFHLAGIARADRYADFYSVNVLYAANLLQALETAGFRENPVLLVGSMAEYGSIRPDQLPIVEETPPRPYNHYGVSKLAQTQMGQILTQAGRKLIMVRPSNVIGPGMGEHLSVQSFTRQIMEIALGSRPPFIMAGNLSTFRDFIDVKEVVNIYWQLIQTPAAYGQVINICSGTATRMEDLLQKLISFSGISIEVRTDPSLFKTVDIPVHYGSNEKLRSILGMVPQNDINSTLKMILKRPG